VLLVICTVPLVLTVASIVAVGLSIPEHGSETIALVIALPPLGGAYLFGLYVLPGLGAAVGVPLLLLGLLPLALAARRSGAVSLRAPARHATV